MSASQSQAPLVAATASRPAGLQKRRYAKLPTLKRARQPPALPSRFASYVQAPVALVVCWHLGISQALRAWFWSAASPCITCEPRPPTGLACFAASARGCPSAPKGLPAVPRWGHAAFGGGTMHFEDMKNTCPRACWLLKIGDLPTDCLQMPQREKPHYHFDSAVSFVYLGWLMGLEPTTTGITILDSTN